MRKWTFVQTMLTLIAAAAIAATAGCGSQAPVTPTPTSQAPTPTLQPTSTSPAPTITPPQPTPTSQPPPPPPVESVGLKLMAEGFASPVGLVPSADGTGRLFVVDQIGVVHVMTPDGSVLSEPFLDLRDRMVSLNPGYDERGLLGLAFHPDFKANGRFFVSYSAPLRATAPVGWDHTSHVSQFTVAADNPNRADPASERVVLEVDQPQINHNAGQIAFGPDGFLYIALGDGGGANDLGTGHPPIGNGQDTSTLLGSILRIDVDGGVPYGIPPDNPFVGKEGADEIYAFGLRNPFRFSFDTGGALELFAADAGQWLTEEVDIIVKGGNYGWRVKEGTNFFDPDNAGVPAPTGPEVDAAGNPFIDPILEYGHAGPGPLGTAVIGGYVYRGVALPSLQGAYVFGDFSANLEQPDGSLFVGARSATSGVWSMGELRVSTSPNGRINAFLRSFGQDSDGELYVLTAAVSGPSGSTGKVYKIVP